MKKQYNIILISTARSDIALWKPIFDSLDGDRRFSCKIIITATHFSDSCGNTFNEAASLFSADKTVFLNPEDGNAFEMSLQSAAMLYNYLMTEPVDLIFFLGDRIELMPLIFTAVNLVKPVAHIYAGEEDLTYTHDTQVRNALTKVAHIIMVTHDDIKQRVLQIGEEEWRIKVVGNTSLKQASNPKDSKIYDFLNQHDISGRYLVNCCYHPTTTTPGVWRTELPEIFKALNGFNEFSYIWTGVNADNEHGELKELLLQNINSRNNHYFFDHLGGELYRSLLNNAVFMIGNSSSGLLEAPIYQLPSINVGNRNAGRLHGPSVIDVPGNAASITEAIRVALAMDKQKIENVFANKNFPDNINEHIFSCLQNPNLMIKRMRPINYTLIRVPEYI